MRLQTRTPLQWIKAVLKYSAFCSSFFFFKDYVNCCWTATNMPWYRLRSDGMGDRVQNLDWTVHSYWFKQTLQGEKVALKVRKDLQFRKQNSDSAKSTNAMQECIAQDECTLNQSPSQSRCICTVLLRSFKEAFKVSVLLVKSSVLSEWRCACMLPLPCPRTTSLSQCSFPEPTVYSNYQANKGPPCAVMGKGEGSQVLDEGVPHW